MQPEIMVIGALGNVGAEVVRALQARQVPVRAADLDTQQVQARFPQGVEPLRFEFGQPETYAPAFQGIRALFVLRPPQISDISRFMVPALEAAKTAGVQHMVFLSLIGIQHNTVVPHYRVEQWMRASGLTYTFLRCSFFMQNLNTTHRAEIRERDEIYVPVGKARTSFLDVRDIGAVAALVLTQPEHHSQAYDLTGPQALDYYQVAELFTQALGRKITYASPTRLQYFLRQLKQHAPLPFALVTTWLYSNTRSGMAEQVTGEVERLLGRKPIPMKTYIEDYRVYWER